MPDISVSNLGPFYVITAMTDRGADWFEDNLIGEQTRTCGGIAVEGRYLDDIVEGARADGLEVEA